MLRNNPEFIKNLKLEFSLTRLVVLTFLLSMVIWIGWTSDKLPQWEKLYTEEQYAAKSLFNYLCGFGFLVTVVWGSYLITSSFLEEVKLKTWDFVRMSSLSPFKILTGKIFGAPAAVWIITLLIGLPALLYAGMLVIPETGIVRPEIFTLAILSVALLAWIILSYSLGLLLSLVANTKISRGAPFSITALIFVSGFSIGGMITSSFLSFHKMIPKLSAEAGAKQATTPVYELVPSKTEWYGSEFYSLDLVAALMCFFALWAFIGAWRALRQSLQYRDQPWAWIGFIVSASFVLHGFSPLDIRGVYIPYWPIVISLSTLILACIQEAGDMVKYRLFFHKLREKSYSDAFRNMPLWIISFCALCVYTFLMVFISTPDISDRMTFFAAALILFVLRDLLAFHAIYWMPNIRRPLLGVMVYALVMYAFLPFISKSIEPQYALLFFPAVEEQNPDIYWPLLLAEIAVFGCLALKYWKAKANKK